MKRVQDWKKTSSLRGKSKFSKIELAKRKASFRRDIRNSLRKLLKTEDFDRDLPGVRCLGLRKGDDCSTGYFSPIYRFIDRLVGRPWEQVNRAIRSRFCSDFISSFSLYEHQGIVVNMVNYIVDDDGIFRKIPQSE